MHYWLVIIPMTMKLCLRGMPTKTFNIHELQVCKQQQIASGNKTNVYAYNLVVLAFLTMRLGTLVHNTTVMSKPHLQVCKQQQIASGKKTSKLMFMPITWLCYRSRL